MNLLQFEASPYLKQHMDNPVQWHPWNKESLQKAVDQQKPILVSIGYSTCHWCHVMAHESFEDPVIADLMNDFFINIKIDREERPDLDHYFMNAVQAMGTSGGWPLNCFLTPEAKPFYGGTYFPPSPNFGRASWKQIILAVNDAFKNRKEEIGHQAKELVAHIQQINQIQVQGSDQAHILDMQQLVLQVKSYFDLVQGGFGSQPKFPHAALIQLIFQLGKMLNENQLTNHGLFSLLAMRKGGLFDQLDGGFCRYSVDGQWDVPHFEKMLYDHAQILQTLADAFAINQDPLMQQVARQAMQFFEEQMQAPNGMFYAAMDADSEGQEGLYYVWKKEELKLILGEDYDVFFQTYSFSNLDHHHTDLKVLRIKSGFSDSTEILANINLQEATLQKLRNARAMRTRPDIDTKLIVVWNAMLASSYCSWYLADGLNKDLEIAQNIIGQLLEQGIHQNSILFRYLIQQEGKGQGFLEDYAYLIKAMLDVYSLTGQKALLEQSKSLMDFVMIHFKDPNSSLLLMNSDLSEDQQLTVVDWSESNYPNANAMICFSCRYLYEALSEKKYYDFMQSSFQTIEILAFKHPISMAGWLREILFYKMGYPVIKSSRISEILPLLRSHYLPGLLLIPDQGQDGFQLCDSGQCFPIVDEPEKLLPLLNIYL